MEKRILERIGHIMRMEDDRMVKAVVLGWVEQLERWERVSGSRRKTVLYWKKLLREAGIDYTKIGLLTRDRKKWKGLVKERMEDLRTWERSKGHKWQGERPERRDAVKEDVMDFVFVCNYCGKVCKSKAGLTIHTKRMHEESAEKKVFVCERCKAEFKQEANLRNHEKICGGEAAADGKIECGKCGKRYAKSYIARHKRTCQVAQGGEEVVEMAQPQARVYRALRKNCPECGVEMAATNISRHLKTACQGGGAYS